MNTLQAKTQFVNWVRKNDPFLYAVAKKRAELVKSDELNGIDIGGFFNNLVDTVKSIAPTVITYQGQKKILDVQIQRARNGLPPLDSSQYTPTVKVEAQLTPENERAAQRIAINTVKESAQGMQKYMLIGIAGVLAYVLLKGRR